jgi:RNA polymerase sigma-70 factor, ECF subfamily
MRDAVLLERCRQGDRDAFRELFEMYQDRVYSIALHHWQGDADAAREVVQRVFVKLFTAIGRYRGESEFSTWLYRLVVNACLDLRRDGRRQVALDDAPGEPACASHEEEFARRELRGSVETAVRSLAEHLRWPILLRYFEDLSYREISAILRCSEGAVASRLHRGHKLLAAKLAHLRGAPAREKTRC